MAGSEFDLIAQSEGNLGERLNHVDHYVRDKGAAHVYFIGSDAPILSPKFYQLIYSQVSDYDITLASSDDGGVTLMGGSKPWPDMIGLPWSTDSLGDELRSLCEEKHLSVQVLDGHYDIDTLADLKRCIHDLRGDNRPQRQRLCKVFDELNLMGYG